VRPSTGVRRFGSTLALALLAVPSAARAADVGTLGGAPIDLDVTETSIAAQHFDARSPPGQSVPTPENFEDSGWFGWINRLDSSLRWERWTLGLRLDSAVYALRPADRALPAYPANEYQGIKNQVDEDGQTRFRNSIYPAKLWATYSAPGMELTAGDAYAQFGRGLTLSMRKVDELGIDTTIRGGKVQISRDPFSITAVAGFGNPSRVDEATGRALWVTSDLAPGDVPTPGFGSDRIVGADLQAGRGLPLTLSTHVVHFSRCAPYHFTNAIPETSFGSDPGTVTFGSCDAADNNVWFHDLNSVPRGLQARDITMAGQSIEVPSLWGHGTLYVEAAVQQRAGDSADTANQNGNALYAALSYDIGRTSSTIELKSNRNFYTVAASVAQQAQEFAIVAYTFVPPAESFNMLDAEGTGDFNACVEGGRFREDVNVSQDLLIYGQGVFAYSLTEQPNGRCDPLGRTLVAAPNLPTASVQDVVWDGVAGVEYSFDDRLSHVFASAGARDDTRKDGVFQYREQHVEYSIAKYLRGPWSLEIQGRHRHRTEQQFNIDPVTYQQPWWYEGETYVALRMAPKWVFTGGFEYTTLIGQPTTYVNGSAIYKFTSSSNLRVFIGEQRAAFRCASGLCRFFPPFEGARAELTLRF
jgi:Family of unknown function (DUF6029)